MPAQAPRPLASATDAIGALGAHIRRQRKALRISATTAAQAAGMSRVTLHRIERGEASVTMGAYANAMAAPGVQFRIAEPVQAAAGLPQRIRLGDYPQLKALAWHAPGLTELSPDEAFGIYERNWRHVDQAQLDASERRLIDELIRVIGKGHLLV